MLQRSVKRLPFRALIVDDELGTQTAEGRAVRTMVEELQARAVEVVEANSAEDGTAVITSDSAIHVILIDWSLGADHGHERAHEFLKVVRARNDKIPIFLMAERGEASDIPVEVMEMVDEFIWTLEDTAAFIGGRVVAAIRRYIEILLPPLASALMKFTQEYEYSWHTPGHAGGTAFLKSPVGRIFFDFFGENLLRSDLSISVGSLGSLLDHTGPIGEHEKYAARVFGAHRTYCVTNGTSMSNRVIFMAAVARDQIALCDRNCHKSIEHSLVMTGAIPTYFVPLRNRFGLIGPIPPAKLRAGVHQGCDQGQSVGAEGRRQARRLFRRHQLDVRRAVLQRAAGRRPARSERRPYPLRRSVVRVRAVQSDLSRSACHARRSAGSQGPDGVRHAFDPQAAGRAVAGLAAAHPRRPQPDSALAVQRVVHAACVDVAAVRDHRLERHHGGDDGWPRRPGADQRIDRGSGRVSADDRARAPQARGEEGLVLQDLEPGNRQEGRQEGSLRGRAGRVAGHGAGRLGASPRRERGTASPISKTTTACSTRSRCRS